MCSSVLLQVLKRFSFTPTFRSTLILLVLQNIRIRYFRGWLDFQRLLIFSLLLQSDKLYVFLVKIDIYATEEHDDMLEEYFLCYKNSSEIYRHLDPINLQPHPRTFKIRDLLDVFLQNREKMENNLMNNTLC